MFVHYLLTSLRNLRQQMLYSSINVIGLATGAAVAILMFLFVRNEWSFDAFHTDSDRIYRAWVKEHLEGEEFFNTVTPFILGSELEDNFPEVEHVVQYLTGNNLVRKGDFSGQEVIHFATPSFFQVFDFPLAAGKQANALDQPDHLVLTREMARKYFGETDPLGQIIEIQIGGDWHPFQVRAVAQAQPANSSIQFNIVVPFEQVKKFVSERGLTSWMMVYPETYVELRADAPPIEALRGRMQAYLDTRVPDDYGPGGYEIGFQPLTDIHLNQEMPAGIVPVSDPRYPYILSAIALLILMLAGINYVSLAVGRSLTRAKEVGVRKVSGASRGQIMAQFWVEAGLTAVLSVGLGVLLAEFALPAFKNIAGMELAISYDPGFFLMLALLATALGGLAGAYPSLLLSGFSPMRVLRGSPAERGPGKHRLLRGLVGLQFVLSMGLITCTLIMAQQLRFLQKKNLGFDHAFMLTLPYAGAPSREKPMSQLYQEGVQAAERLKGELDRLPEVKGLTTSSHTPGTPGWVQVGYRDPDSRQFRRFNFLQVDHDYFDLMGIDMAEGRSFSRDQGTDAVNGLIINRAMADAFGWGAYLGQNLPPPFDAIRLVGISENFHFDALYQEVGPLAMAINPEPVQAAISDINIGDTPLTKITLKLSTDDMAGTIAEVGRAWKKVAPDQPYNYGFLDESLAKQYEGEQRLSQVLGLATGLALFIAALGLFGMATIITARRIKEIGVRKVMGASSFDIVVLLNRHITALVLGASFIAIPVSWYLMRQWLADFAYRAPISPWLILAAALATLLIAWLAVSYQTLKAARANPVKALRYE